MMMSGRRSERVAEAVRETLAHMLLRDLKDPRIGMVTLTSVQMSDDLRHAKVYFSCFGDQASQQQSLKGLQSAAGFIRRQLMRRLQLRYAPELAFHYDAGLEGAERVSHLLRTTDSADE